MRPPRSVPQSGRRPVIGVLCCNEQFDRPVQTVASRFIEPLANLSQATVLLVPAIFDAFDALAVADRLDGLLLTGSRSNVASHRYGVSATWDEPPLDEQRDEVALRLAARMIEQGRPVFGICRGLQELNVLFGGTLIGTPPGDIHHHPEPGLPFGDLFDHEHAIDLTPGGMIAQATGAQQLTVNSVHRQGIDRLGSGLEIEAIAPDDGLIEGFSAYPCGAPVLAVQWHPEWNAAQRPEGRAFFRLIGEALRAPAHAD